VNNRQQDIGTNSNILEGLPPDLLAMMNSGQHLSVDNIFDFLIGQDQVQTQQIRDVVPIQEWVRDEYYLGDEARTLYSYWEDVIVDFVGNDMHELIITGSLRSGKSNTALLLLVRKLYELTCFSPIPARFGLSTSSLIVFMYLSLSMSQAMMLGLGRVRRMLDKIPYFREVFPRDKGIESYIRFADPAVVLIGGSELGHFKGSDLFFLIFDEANFTKGGVDMKFDNAVNIYREATVRRKSTFITDGKEHGIGIIVSSADTLSSFVETRIAECKGDPKVMIINAVHYEVQPERYAGQGRFWVFEGDDLIDPFIVDDDREALLHFCNSYQIPFDRFKIDTLPKELRTKFRNPPETFKRMFQLDIFGALKEICGVSIGQSGRFFTNRVKFAECFPAQNSVTVHPFTKEAITISYLDEARVEDYWNPARFNLNPNFEYFGGIDQSLTDDTTGISLCHIDPDAEDDLKIVYDFMLKILPPRRPAKISPDKITMFFVWLKDKVGIRNLQVSMDWYATQQSVQTLQRYGIEAFIHGIDRSWDDYRSLSGSILDNQISGYHYAPFKEELFSLIQDNERKKVDHPGGGSKDVSDSVVQSHRLAVQAYLDIKGGLRYFPNFGLQNMRSWKHDHEAEAKNKLVAGIYFGPEAFYVCWVLVQQGYVKEALPIRVVGEYVDNSGSNEIRAFRTKERTAEYGVANPIYAGDPTEGIMKADVTSASPLRVYRKLGLPIRCRKHMDRNSMDPIFNLTRNKTNPGIWINETECPLLCRALRKAKYRLVNGVKTGAMQNSGEEYPAIALRVALEEALTKASASGY